MVERLKFKFEGDERDLKRAADATQDELKDTANQAEKTGRALDQAFDAQGTSRFQGASTAISGIGQGITTIGTGVGLLGAAAVAGYVQFADKTIELANVANETGIPLDELAQLQHVLNYQGYDFGSVEAFFDRVSEISVEALKGDEGAVQLLADLDLTVDDLIGPDGSLRDPDDLFYLFAGAIGVIEDPARRSAAATKTFGEDADFVPGLLSGDGLSEEELGALSRALAGIEDPAITAAVGLKDFDRNGNGVLLSLIHI